MRRHAATTCTAMQNTLPDILYDHIHLQATQPSTELPEVVINMWASRRLAHLPEPLICHSIIPRRQHIVATMAVLATELLDTMKVN